ncbi:tRNA (N(6)-L-threonylcarbamoyladenosine(37)-C(2))-methylthiotransferase MtaB [Lacrimispora sphenoides]|uniref:Threonylcarbamoyladenosine tRNA methylthiotransferase MtaB n=1 Tax=Lacrimispora sphenoides JCM 1415 TaxID=1297793 RepID=A0ABY1C0T6_9FIRM|nr:tRNA (N(6)-L-threonylcarbamoyladenosine(37)-C(2))-methylthiotransferase MtaB [Lacrimispora sphenoides]SET49744.1 threonylcarbamoyladenosine tRNA methylthiotransferase MtaB [[Clostridium] sphenoides JCM 1415]SUY49459.1 MiaB-like tRNA modifying enzyme [Lacrimispora sphenoides]
MKKAALHNLGCKVNSYETEAMQQLLENAGYEIVPFAEGADVYIINTCSVTNIADRKSRQMLHRAKKMNPEAVVVAAGCYVQAAGEELKKDEAVDLVVGNNKKTELVSILEDYFAQKKKPEEIAFGQTAAPDEAVETVIDINDTMEYENLSIDKISDHTRAFIKVQDGCNQFCSYCIIPYTRGRVRSRKPDEVVEEVKRLTTSGYQEIVLTGIHLSSYGKDFPEEERLTLLDLIKSIHDVEGLKRIRLGSLEPRIVTEEFASELAGLHKICPHFHLSLQSGCDNTLKRMNRHYTTEDYLNRCQILRKAFKNPAITTDVIVGFPGERSEDFQVTKEYLKNVQFYEMHVFKYSKRNGTRAAVMPDQVPESIKAERSNDLLCLEKEMSLEYRKSWLGSRVEVLMEEEYWWNDVHYMIGHTREYVKAAVPFEEGLKGVVIEGTLMELMNDEVAFLKY